MECLQCLAEVVPSSESMMQCFDGIASSACVAVKCMKVAAVVPSAASALKNCFPARGYEVGRGKAQATEAKARDTPLERLLCGDDIKAELEDMEVDAERVVAESTVTAKGFVKKCPIFFFGLSRQGKSTLINGLLELMESKDGVEGLRADVKFDQPCTRGVKVYRKVCTSWTTPDVEEEVLFLDTEGWEFGKKPGDIFEECMLLAKKEDIQKKVLQHRLVLVCCLSFEDRSNMYDPKYKKLVKGICKQASREACGGKPVLLPVITKRDLARTESELQHVVDKFRGELHGEVNEFVEVHEAVSVNHPGEPGADKASRKEKLKTISNLKDALAAVCKQQLKSQHILGQVKKIIEADFKDSLIMEAKKGIDAEYALVRRYLWVCARHRGLRIRGLYKEKPTMSWNDTDGVRKSLEVVPNTLPGANRDDDWHTDPRREKSGRRPGADMTRSTSMSTAAMSGGSESPIHTP